MLLVVAFHAGLPLPGGFIGVDVFFVISGFVITGMLGRELLASGVIRLRDFYTRRARRILPAIALLTTAVAVLSAVLQSSLGSQQITAKTGLGATFLVANLVIYREPFGYFDPASTTNPLLNTWTLSVEEQFYLVFPILLIVGAVLGRRLFNRQKFGAIILVLLVLAISFGASVLLSFGLVSLPEVGDSSRFAFFSSLTRAWEFAVGALLALAVPLLARIPTRAATALGVAGFVAIVLGALRLSDVHYPGVAALVPVLGAAALIAAGCSSAGGVSTLLGLGPMVWIGDLSYSWYLWHWPLLVFAGLLTQYSVPALILVAVLSIVPAWLSFRLVEQPVRGNRTIRGRRVLVLTGVCVAIPAAGCLLLWAGADSDWHSEPVKSFNGQVSQYHADLVDGCNLGVPLGERPPGKCVWNKAAKGPMIYLLGDSNAGQYSEALIGAATNSGSTLTIATLNTCPFMGGNFYRYRTEYQECSNFVNKTMKWLQDQPPGIVVLAAKSDGYINGSDWFLQGPGNGPIATTTSGKSAIWEPSLEPTLRTLRDAGHQVLVIHPTPHFWNPGYQLWFPDECTNIVALVDTPSCGRTQTLEAVVADQAAAFQAEDLAAARAGAQTLDLRAELCPAGSCSTNHGNSWSYRDGAHITVDESESLSQIFTAELTKLVDRSEQETSASRSAPSLQ